jgi:hypothetical protein
MAAILIRAPVGIRNGLTMLPNRQDDLDKITKLFDSIPTDRGGTRESIGAWATIREILIVEVAAQITIFQGANEGLTVDGAIDPTGLTLKRMNAMSGGGGGVDIGITARVVPVGGGYSETGYNQVFQTVNPSTVFGTAPIDPITGAVNYVRKLVRVENCSINWFGVLFKNSDNGAYFGKEPHIFFTPTPVQGGYSDGTYDTFGGSPPWSKLWHDYTWGMGRQICLANADQVLVIPFYRTSQHSNLGNFLGNWKEVIEKVVTAAIDSIDVMYLRDGYTFDTICSSSFSNGWKPHSLLHEQGVGAAAMTRVAFDLDGQAAKPPSHWRPSKGVIYLDLPPPFGMNPRGNEIFVGNRWKNFYKYWPEGFRSHSACSSYLLFHGVWQYCT